MAEINISRDRDARKNGLQRKSSRIDMTPMVDLGFLLITFFMFAASFSKPNILDLGFPAGNVGTEIDFRNQITFVLGENDKIFYYQKELKELGKADFKEVEPGVLAVPNLVNAYKKNAQKPEFFTIIIKPTENANYKNFVDILDDIALSKNDKYSITDLQPAEKRLYDEIMNK